MTDKAQSHLSNTSIRSAITDIYRKWGSHNALLNHRIRILPY
uniref:Uncharacterized protein n=1 Tax=Anguilla anguilla TaxID=7936 RepID=A0A0E9RF51_ANGAN